MKWNSAHAVEGVVVSEVAAEDHVDSIVEEVSSVGVEAVAVEAATSSPMRERKRFKTVCHFEEEVAVEEGPVVEDLEDTLGVTPPDPILNQK